MDESLLSLKWNNHKSAFFDVLSSLREKEAYTDATLTCEGKFFPVHKFILSTCSDYFSEIFEHTSCKSPVIVLKDIRHQDLECLLDYMYVGEVDVRQCELAGLINAAECLRIKGLAIPDEDPIVSSSKKRRYSGQQYKSPKRLPRSTSQSSNHSSIHSFPLITPSPIPSDTVNSLSSPPRASVDQPENPLINQENFISVDTIKLEAVNCGEYEERENYQHISAMSGNNISDVSMPNMTENVLSKTETFVTEEHEFGNETSVPGPSGTQEHNSMASWGEREQRVSSANGQHEPLEGVSSSLENHFKMAQWLQKQSETTPSRGFVCCVCNKNFIHNWELTRHMRTHTGEKPFACPHCRCQFSHSHSRLRHVRSKHMAPVENISRP